MAKSIYQTKKLNVGRFGLGISNGKIGTIKQQTNDGDTVTVRALGNFGVRLLGIDAPETKLPILDSTAFYSTGGEEWRDFIENLDFSRFKQSLDIELQSYLRSKIVPGAMENHHLNAKNSEKIFEEEIVKDLIELDVDKDNFEMFAVFVYEIMDRYGRLLCFLNRYEPEVLNSLKGRPLSYNERLLRDAYVAPYFIWPNINPFRKMGGIIEAVFDPGTANLMAESDLSLKIARKWVKDSREKKVGIYSPQTALILQPFEVRFLSRLEPPNRWVIDLSKDEDLIHKPQNYFKIENSEDRLFIPEEYIPLFKERGWRLED